MQIIVLKSSGAILPIEDISVKILQKLNEHATAYVTGLLPQEAYSESLETTTSETEFVVECVDTDDNSSIQTLFVGLCKAMRNINQEPIRNTVILVEIEIISYSYLMDIKKTSRSFQDREMLYDELLTVVNRDNGSTVYGNTAAGAVTNRFILQYNETNWDFIKRLASRFNEPLICDHLLNKPGYRFGVINSEDRGVLESYDYSVSKNISDFRISSQNEYIRGANEFDFTQFKIITEGNEPIIYCIGDFMTYRGATLYISEIETDMKNSSFTSLYKICSRNGLKQKPFNNTEIRGISLLGNIIDVDGNNLKLHLIDIDENQPVESAYWFKYATFYSTFYCMPEKGDLVNLHFPTDDEGKAVVINSVKKDPASGCARDSSMVADSNTQSEAPDTGQGPERPPPVQFQSMANNPKVKMLSTDCGKTVALTDTSIVIQCNGGTFITLVDGMGIDILTAEDITVNSLGNISLLSKDTIVIDAAAEIEIKSGDSLIKLDPAEIMIKATDTKMN